MGQRILATALVVLTCAAGFPQADDWRARMDEGGVAERAGDYAKAASLYREATQIAEGFEARDKRRALAWNSLATMHETMGRFADAESGYRRALREAAESSGKSGPEYALVLSNLGAAFVETGQAAAGEKLVREALAIYSAADPRDEFRIASMQNGLAEILCLGHKHKEAEPLLIQALAVLEKKPGAWGETALAKNALGVVRYFEGNPEEAKRLILQGLTMMEEHLGPEHPMLIRFLNNLAPLQNLSGHREEAGQGLRRALDIAKTRLGAEHPTYALLLSNYAAFLRQGGDKSGAKVLEAQSTQILKDSGRINGVGVVIDVNSLRSK